MSAPFANDFRCMQVDCKQVLRRPLSSHPLSFTIRFGDHNGSLEAGFTATWDSQTPPTVTATFRKFLEVAPTANHGLGRLGTFGCGVVQPAERLPVTQQAAGLSPSLREKLKSGVDVRSANSAGNDSMCPVPANRRIPWLPAYSENCVVPVSLIGGISQSQILHENGNYSVSSRVHEIEIRLALGARSKDILRMIMTEGTTLIGIRVMHWHYAGSIDNACDGGKHGPGGAKYRAQPLGSTNCGRRPGHSCLRGIIGLLSSSSAIRAD